MTLRDDLVTARARIADRLSWCQGREALSADGHDVSPRSTVATRRCGLGAIRALPYGQPDRDRRVLDAERRLQASCRRLFGREVADVNDGAGGVAPEAAHGMVVMAYDAAIADAR